MVCFEICKTIYEEMGNERDYSRAVGNMGIVHWYKGNYDKAMECYETDKKICEEAGDRRGYGKALSNMGLVYRRQGANDLALECYEIDKKICKEIGDKLGYCRAYTNMGIVYRHKGDYDQSIECHEMHKKISMEIGDKNGYYLAISNMGSVYGDKGDFDQAMECFEIDKKVCGELGDKNRYAMTISNMGDVYRFKGNSKQALECFEEAIAINRELGVKFDLCSSLQNYAALNFDLQRLENAKTFNDEALTIAEMVGRLDVLFNARILGEKINLCLLANDESRFMNTVGFLAEMLIQTQDPAQQATLHYELWRMTKDFPNLQDLENLNPTDSAGTVLTPSQERTRRAASQHRRSALELYQKLYEKTPKFEYKQRIEELSK